MRWAQSYSIIDHQIFHGGYLSRLSQESMVLYLFLVVVGDRQGRSFYSDRSVTDILRLTGKEFNQARNELISEGLISFRRPYWQVKNITQRRSNGRNDTSDNTVSSGRPETELLSDTGQDRDFAKACLTNISRMLSGK